MTNYLTSRIATLEAERDRLAARVAELEHQLRQKRERTRRKRKAAEDRLQQATEALSAIGEYFHGDSERQQRIARSTLAALAGEDGCGMAGCVREGKASQKGECACIVAGEDDDITPVKNVRSIDHPPPQREGDYL